MKKRKVSAFAAGFTAALHPEWVRTFNTICEPPVTLWCDGGKVMMRAVHNEGKTEYEIVEYPIVIDGFEIVEG